jgi:hypothetical protein
MLNCALRILLVIGCIRSGRYGVRAAPSSICVLPSGEKVTGPTDCSTGEVMLLGNFVNLGVHNVGSFGTASKLDSTYYSKKLGFIADYDRNGFENGYAGDYFMPGAPLEGWLMKYTPYGESSIITVNEGLMDREMQGVEPSELLVTSDDESQSLLWAGSAGDVEIKKVIHLGNNQLYFTTSVVIKNIGSKALADFHCKFYVTRAVPHCLCPG